MKEVRIYFECLEQAAHFIKPILEQTEAFKNKLFEIKLIKFAGNFKFYSKLIASVVYLKDPDILITTVQDGIEYPLFQLEISTAVFTEDHELQRFDGIVASTENNCIYGKVSPINKISPSAHGGNTKFNYLTSYKAIYDKLGKLAFHFDCACDKKGNVIVNPDYMSCPAEVGMLASFLKRLISFISVGRINFNTWLIDFEKELVQEVGFPEWIEKMKSFNLPELKTLTSSRTEWRETNKELYLKINRFGHAMDPERGMLAYYGTMHDNTIAKMIFNENNTAWYKDTPSEELITKYLENQGLKSASDFLYCFLLGSGTHRNKKFVDLTNKFIGTKERSIDIDLSDFLVENFHTLNKALRTVFKFSRQFHITDADGAIRIKFFWKSFKSGNSFDTHPDITPINNRKVFDEDDITYISVHNVLKQNGYKLIAVSYPGAQGDRVVLAESGTGRRQQRRYIDIISYLPKSHSALQENKGKYSPSSLQYEITELAKYKTDDNYKKTIEGFVDRFEVEAPKVFKVGIGFWANRSFTVKHILKLDVDKLDYFIFIKPDKSSWKVFCTGEAKLFTKTEGKVDLPQVYEVSKTGMRPMSFFDSYLQR